MHMPGDNVTPTQSAINQFNMKHAYNTFLVHKFVTHTENICLKKHLQGTVCTRAKATTTIHCSRDLDEAQVEVKYAGCKTKHAQPTSLLERKNEVN